MTPGLPGHHVQKIGLEGLPTRPRPFGKSIADIVGDIADLQCNHACILHALLE